VKAQGLAFIGLTALLEAFFFVKSDFVQSENLRYLIGQQQRLALLPS
jgi:hypothetical protein